MLTAIYTRKSHEENMVIKYITDERRKWRENIKSIMADLSEAVQSSALNDGNKIKTRKLATYLKLSINHDPKHKIDNCILGIITELCDNPNYEKFKELEREVAFLLKHDWERAKIEAKPSISPLLLILFSIAIVWVSFKYWFMDSRLYEELQKIEQFSGFYNEIILVVSVVIFSLLLLPYLYNYALNKKSLRDVLKLRE
ncbi:hypothetical protein AAFX60_005620 [Aliivibrio fischeri]